MANFALFKKRMPSNQGDSHSQLSNSGDQAATQWIEMGDTIQPDPEKSSFYQKRVSRYTDFMDAINRVSEK